MLPPLLSLSNPKPDRGPTKAALVTMDEPAVHHQLQHVSWSGQERGQSEISGLLEMATCVAPCTCQMSMTMCPGRLPSRMPACTAAPSATACRTQLQT